MTLSEKFLRSHIKGVDQYIVVDPAGQIVGHDISDPQRALKMVFSCGQAIQAIGKNKFRYATFLRENNKSMMIFPVGTYFLGVEKKKEADPLVLVNLILSFVDNYLKQCLPTNGSCPKD